LAVDDGAGRRAQELDVERAVPARLVQRLDHLVDAARLRRPRFPLLGLPEPRAVGDEHRQAAARVGGNLDRERADDILATVRAEQQLEGNRTAGARTWIVEPYALERARLRLLGGADGGVDAVEIDLLVVVAHQRGDRRGDVRRGAHGSLIAREQ